MSRSTGRAGRSTRSGSWESSDTWTTRGHISGCSKVSNSSPPKWPWTSGCTWNWMFQGAPAGARASAGMPRSPGSSCAPTPAGMNGNCAPSYVAASACRVRPLHTSLVNGSGYRPGRMPWLGPEEPSASRTFTPRHSAWALWVLTRCARRLPASKDAQQSPDGPGRHDISLPDRHRLRVPLALSRKTLGAVKTHEQRLHHHGDAVTPDEQVRSHLTSKTSGL